MPQVYIFFIISCLFFIWLSGLSFLYFRQSRFFTHFTKGISKNDLKTILKNIADSLKTIGLEIDSTKKDIKQIVHDDRTHFQRFGFVRFNPFSDTGGDQSFCLCLLDRDNHGFVITSLHSREQTRIYAKPIKAGKSPQSQLSKEEIEAVKLALASGPK